MAGKRHGEMNRSIHVIDSHTAGEPTRVIVDGGPDLGTGSVAQQLQSFRDSHDHLRAAIAGEPRGSDVLVGAMLCQPSDPSCDAGVIFFNNVGFLGMCGHGLIGVVKTLSYLNRLPSNECRIETSVGIVTANRHPDGSVSVQNVPSYRVAKDVEVSVDGVGRVVGDVAWGGNWFFLVNHPQTDLKLADVDSLQQVASRIRVAINQAGFPQVDHVELFGPPEVKHADSKNFVLCPGFQYDRSPCGTGTSAKLACLAVDGKLKPGERWIQEGIMGMCFEGAYRWCEPTDDQSNDCVVPTITGRAYVTSEAKLIFAPDDPLLA